MTAAGAAGARKANYAKLYYQVNRFKFAAKYWSEREELAAMREIEKTGGATGKKPRKNRRHFQVVEEANRLTARRG